MAPKTAKNRHPWIDRLDEYAERTRETNTDIATRLGCDRTTVAKCRKRGRVPKNIAVRRALAKLLGIAEKKASVRR